MKTQVLINLTTLVLAGSVLAKAPSSEIPAKRNFPLSTKISPCQDFHKYVCSEAEAAFKLREDRSRHTFSFSDSAERLLKAKMAFFKNINKEKGLSPRSIQIKNSYLACMNKEAGIKAEKGEVKRIVDAMAKIKTADELNLFMQQAWRSGSPSFINVGPTNNVDKPEINDAYVFIEFMNLPEQSYYEDAELMADYKKLISDFFLLIDDKLTKADADAKADRMLSLEKSFAKEFPLPAVQRQRWSEKRDESQSDILKKYSNLKLENIFKEIPKDTRITNMYPESLSFYSRNLSDSNVEVLKDYFLYSALTSVIDDSNPAYFNKQFEFSHKYLGGAAKRSERQERCTRRAMSAFPKELDQLLIPRLFPNFPSEKFKQVASKIRESIISGLRKNTWLEESSRAKAILKIESAKLYLIKPENDKEWDFAPVSEYSATDRIKNTQTYAKSNIEKGLKSLVEGANLEAWAMGPLTVNAYYDPTANKFVMPMGILQYPFFNDKGDLIENLGAVGAVIGHELGHGIDDQGSKYDEKGQLKQWMSMKDLKEFGLRGQKLIAQFNKAGHNGELTLGENIGDLVGLTFAYNAAFNGAAKVDKADQQKLYVSYARLWCGIARPKAIEEQLKTDPHALGWARINEQVKHQKAFAEAFNCKAGDKMVLPDADRVSIW